MSNATSNGDCCLLLADLLSDSSERMFKFRSNNAVNNAYRVCNIPTVWIDSERKKKEEKKRKKKEGIFKMS